MRSALTSSGGVMVPVSALIVSTRGGAYAVQRRGASSPRRPQRRARPNPAGDRSSWDRSAVREPAAGEVPGVDAALAVYARTKDEDHAAVTQRRPMHVTPAAAPAPGPMAVLLADALSASVSAWPQLLGSGGVGDVDSPAALGGSGAVHRAQAAIEGRRANRTPLSELETATLRTERLFPFLPRLEALQVHATDTVVTQLVPCPVLSAEETALLAALPRQPPTDGGAEGSPLPPPPQTSTAAAAVCALPEAAPSLGYQWTLVAGGDAVPSGTVQAVVEAATNETYGRADEMAMNLLGVKSDSRHTASDGGPVALVPLTLRPLPPADRLRLMQFLCVSRGVAFTTLSRVGSSANANATDNIKIDDETVPSLEAIQRFVATGPPPTTCDVGPLIEAKAAGTFAAPALAFALYTENVATAGAIEAIAARLSVPARAFRAATSARKECAATVVCYVLPHTLLREHLLLINVLAFPGFVIRIANITTLPDALLGGHTDQRVWNTLFESPASAAGGQARRVAPRFCAHPLALSPMQPVVETSRLLRRVGGGTRAEIESSLAFLRDVGGINYTAASNLQLISSGRALLKNAPHKAFLALLFSKQAHPALKAFIIDPSVKRAVAAKAAARLPRLQDTLLRNYLDGRGDFDAALLRTARSIRMSTARAMVGIIFNGLASARIRLSATEVLVGDFVAARRRPAVEEAAEGAGKDAVVDGDEDSADAEGRSGGGEDELGAGSFSAADVLLITTPEEAAAYSIADVVMPMRPLCTAATAASREFLASFAPDGAPCVVNTKKFVAEFLVRHGVEAAFATDALAEAVQRYLYQFHADRKPVTFRRLIRRPLDLRVAVMADVPLERHDRHTDTPSPNTAGDDAGGNDERHTSGGNTSVKDAGDGAGLQEAFSAEGFQLLEDGPKDAHGGGTSSSTTTDMRMINSSGSRPLGEASGSAPVTVTCPDALRLLLNGRHVELLAASGVDAGLVGGVGDLLPTRAALHLAEAPSDADDGHGGSGAASTSSGGGSFLMGGLHRRSKGVVAQRPLVAPDRLDALQKHFTIHVRFVSTPSATDPTSLLEGYVATRPVDNKDANALQHHVHRNQLVAAACLVPSALATEEAAAAAHRALFSRITLSTANPTPRGGSPAPQRATAVLYSPAPARAASDLSHRWAAVLQAPRSVAPPYATRDRPSCPACFMFGHVDSAQCPHFTYLKRNRRAATAVMRLVGGGTAATTPNGTGVLSGAVAAARVSRGIRVSEPRALPASAAPTDAAMPLPTRSSNTSDAGVQEEYAVVLDRSASDAPWGFFAADRRLTRFDLPAGGPVRAVVTATDLESEAERVLPSVAALPLAQGLVIDTVNGIPVATHSELAAAVRSNRKGEDYAAEGPHRLRLTLTRLVPAGTQPTPPLSPPSGSSLSTPLPTPHPPAAQTLFPLEERLLMSRVPAQVTITRERLADRWGIDVAGCRLLPFAPSVAPRCTSGSPLVRTLLCGASGADGTEDRLFRLPPARGIGALASSPTVFSDTVVVVRGSSRWSVATPQDLADLMQQHARQSVRLALLCDVVRLPAVRVRLSSSNISRADLTSNAASSRGSRHHSSAAEPPALGLSLAPGSGIVVPPPVGSMFAQALLDANVRAWCSLTPAFRRRHLTQKDGGHQWRREWADDDDEDGETPRERDNAHKTEGGAPPPDEEDPQRRHLLRHVLYDDAPLAASRWRLEAVNGTVGCSVRDMRALFAGVRSGATSAELTLRMVVPHRPLSVNDDIGSDEAAQ